MFFFLAYISCLRTVALNAVARRLDLRHVTLANHSRHERRTVNRLIIKRYVDQVFANFGGNVRHGASAVSIVTAANRRFTRTFDRNAKPTLAGGSSIDEEFGRPSNVSHRQSRSVSSHQIRRIQRLSAF